MPEEVDPLIQRLRFLIAEWNRQEDGHDSDHATGRCKCPCAYRADDLEEAIAHFAGDRVE